MKTRDQSVIAVVVLIIMALGGYFIFVQPEHHKADNLQTQIAAAQTALSQAESQVQAGVAAEAKYKTYAKQLKSITAAVPGDTQIPELINELQRASTRNAIGFHEVSVGGATSAVVAAPTTGSTTASFPSQSFSLSFTGSYFHVANLLQTLASYVRSDDKHFKATGRLISISAVSLAPGGSDGSAATGDVSASVTALDYDVPASLLSSASATTAGATTP